MTSPFDPVRFELPKELTNGATAHDLRATLRPLVRQFLDGEPGFFLLTGLDHLDPSELRTFTLAASASLGGLLPQDRAGTLLREVRDRGVKLGEGRTGRYSDSRQGGNLHTDSPHRPGAVPAYFALACVHQAAKGGDLVLVRLAEILGSLPEQERLEVFDVLRRPVHFDTRDDTPGAPRTVVRPVLESIDGTTYVRYLREYIELGHRHPGVPPLTDEQIRAFDTLDALLEDPDIRSQERLHEGEVIFIDNRWTLHGRVEFQDRDGAKKRLILRTWIVPDES